MTAARIRDRATGRRARVAGPRGAVALAALLLAGTAAVGPTAVTATARPQVAAACGAGSDGVTVVVDFGTLPGGVQIRCVTQPVTSGFDALQKAGFTYAGTQRFPGLLCRIDGKPADDPCVNAPPPDRYWAYWTAPEPGGKWTYSDLGAGNRTPPPGSVEGWAFSDGCTRAPQGPPCPSPTTTTRPRATTTTTARSGSSGGTIGSGDRSPTTTTAGAVGGSGAGSPTTDPGPTTTTTEVPEGATAPEPGEEGQGGDGTGEQAAAAAPDAGDGGGGGSAAGALTGLGIVAGLGAVTWLTLRRRGAEQEPA